MNKQNNNKEALSVLILSASPIIAFILSAIISWKIVSPKSFTGAILFILLFTLLWYVIKAIVAGIVLLFNE